MKDDFLKIKSLISHGAVHEAKNQILKIDQLVNKEDQEEIIKLKINLAQIEKDIQSERNFYLELIKYYESCKEFELAINLIDTVPTHLLKNNVNIFFLYKINILNSLGNLLELSNCYERLLEFNIEKGNTKFANEKIHEFNEKYPKKSEIDFFSVLNLSKKNSSVLFLKRFAKYLCSYELNEDYSKILILRMNMLKVSNQNSKLVNDFFKIFDFESKFNKKNIGNLINLITFDASNELLILYANILKRRHGEIYSLIIEKYLGTKSKSNKQINKMNDLLKINIGKLESLTQTEKIKKILLQEIDLVKDISKDVLSMSLAKMEIIDPFFTIDSVANIKEESKSSDVHGTYWEEKILSENNYTEVINIDQKTKSDILTEIYLREENGQFAEMMDLIILLFTLGYHDSALEFIQKKSNTKKEIEIFQYLNFKYVECSILIEQKKYSEVLKICDLLLKDYPLKKEEKVCFMYFEAESFRLLGLTEEALRRFKYIKSLNPKFRLTTERINELEKT